MAFGFAGAAQGASRALEEIVAQRLLEQKLEAEIADRQSRMQMDRDRMQLDRERLGESVRASKVDEGQRQQTIDLSDRTRRDRNNEQGLDLMNRDRQAMDLDAAVAGLPAHLKPLGPLMKAGGVGKISPEDVEDPAVKAEREAKLREQNVRDQIRIRQASRAPQAPREKKQVWVKRGEQVVPIDEGTAQPGDTPYDPVAARSSQPANLEEARDTAREARRLAIDLRKHAGLGGAFGVMDQYLPTLKQGTADAVAIRDALTSLLTLENTGKLKGVLSNTDMQILRQASTTLAPGMSEGAARNELKRIAQVMSKVTGDPDPFADEDKQQGSVADPKVLELIKKYGGGR